MEILDYYYKNYRGLKAIKYNTHHVKTNTFFFIQNLKTDKFVKLFQLVTQ